jgi:hypothetical protein
MNWRKIVYRISFGVSLAMVGAVTILSWLYPEHLR